MNLRYTHNKKPYHLWRHLPAKTRLDIEVFINQSRRYAGYCILREAWHTLGSTDLAFLDTFAYFSDFNVLEKHRGKGIGIALFLHMLDAARTLNYNGVWWRMNGRVYNSNDPAHRIYANNAINIEGTPLWYVEF